MSKRPDKNNAELDVNAINCVSNSLQPQQNNCWHKGYLNKTDYT